MNKERDSKMMKLIVNESLDVGTSDVVHSEPVETKVYKSDPIKSDLYSKLLAFRQSQKKFKIQDLIRDSLK